MKWKQRIIRLEEFIIGILALTGGIVCMIIPLLIYIPEIKKANFAKEKWSVVIDFIIDPFTGLTALFYLGFLLTLYGLFII